MAVDFHMIGTGVSSGKSHNGFGYIVSNFVPSGSFPPAGSYAGTFYGVEYPVELGGASLTNPVTSATVPTQTCDVDELHDGTGGTYLDALSVTNINYVPDGTLFATSDTYDASQSPVEVPSGSGNYYDAEFSYTYFYHNGEGSYRAETDHWQYFFNGTHIMEDYSGYQLEVPNGSGNFFATGKYDWLNWDGSGNYVTGATNQGSFYPVGTQITNVGNDVEVPSGSANFYYNGTGSAYKWNGTGGIGNIVGYGSYYAVDTYITDNGTVAWYWDGTGDFYEGALP